MNKYYREPGVREGVEATDIWAEYLDDKGSSCTLTLRSVEVDDWHPASDPPKPEDFEPTGYVETILPNGTPFHADKVHWSKYGENYKTWRKITPPKR